MIIMAGSLLLMAAAGSAPNCANPATHADTSECATRDFQRADAALNRQWRVTSDEMKRRDAAERGTSHFNVLLDSQRAWITFRDTHCRATSYMERGGTLGSLLLTLCRTNLTDDRIHWLADLAEGQG